MRRRRFLGLASGVAGSVALTATGCGSGGGASRTGDVTLTMVASDHGDLEGKNPTQEYWDEVVASFEEQNPGIRVKVSVHARGKAEQKVAEMVGNDRAPDLAQIDSFAGHAAAGRLYRADDVLSIPVQADFVSALSTAGELRRVRYAMPFTADIQLLFYNRGLFAEAGLDPEKPPRTWEELKQAAVALKAVGVDVPYGLPLGSEEAPTEAMTWMLGNGGGYTGDGGMYAINAPANVEAMGWLRDELVDQGLTTSNPAVTNRQGLFNLFTGGHVGMLNGDLSLTRQADRKKTDYGTAPLPGRDGLSDTTTGSAGWMLAFRREGNREAVAAFLDHVYDVENQFAFADRYHTLPVTVSASDRMRGDKRHKRMRPFLDQLGAAEFFPSNKVSWAKVNREIGLYVGQSVLADGDPAAVLGTLQRTAEKEEEAAKDL